MLILEALKEWEKRGEMTSYFERIEKASQISRRGFVKVGAAAAALAAVGLSGCSNGVEQTSEADTEAMMAIGSDGRDVISGEWVTAACWHNCGGRCVNKALVRDGIVIRQKTDDSQEDSETFLQQRSCSRGHSQRMQCFSADRLKYPMKRKNWSPEEPNGKLRGIDEWERISWDEAFTYVGNELNKAYDTYGPQSVLMCGGKTIGRVLNARGGACSISDSSSFGTYAKDLSNIGLSNFDWRFSANDRFDLKNADWIVFHGNNPAWSGWALTTYYFLQAKRAGTQFVVIGPAANATCQTLDARWIPVHAGTDTAFMLGVAYEMLKLDEEKGDVIDWDFLETYTIGFDDEHMPSGVDKVENIKGYLMGDYDNTPKTAEWASTICGTPVEDIRWYAELLGKNNTVSMLHGYALARCNGAEDVPQLFMTLGAMGGHFGKPGHCCGSSSEYSHANGGPFLVTEGDAGLPAQETMVVDDAIPAPMAWQSILDKKYHYCGAHYGFLAPAEERELDIHVIFHEQAASLQNTPDLMKGIEAHRSVDFVFTSAQFLTTQAKYSDIVLPCTTEWERVGGFTTADREFLYIFSQVTDPLYEAKSDQEIGKGIAEAMGLDPLELYPLSEKQQFMNKILGSSVVEPDESTSPLVTITQDDLDSWECEGTPQEGKIALNDFIERGFFQVERSEGDAYSFIAYEDFITDPTSNPLPSESGKFEIYCQPKADELNNIGLTTTFKPYPSYHAPIMGYEAGFTNLDQKTPGDYPFVAYNPHYYRRAHSTMDNVTWLRETWSNPVFLNRSDAEAKGISDGDTVCVYNQFGKVLRYATLLETMMPGMVGIPHGAWIDLDDKGEYDLAGSDNVLCGTVAWGMTVSGYNNYNVNFEKYDGDALELDYKKAQRVIEL